MKSAYIPDVAKKHLSVNYYILDVSLEIIL